MAKQVFVSNLDWNTSDEALHRAFAPYGDILEARWLKWDAGRRYGLGVVSFRDDAAARAAIAAMQDAELDGHRLVVDTSEETVTARKRERWS